MGIGKLVTMLRSLGLVDTITTVASNALTTSHVSVSKKIDAMCVSSDISILAASFFHLLFSVGDHIVKMVDFNKNNLLDSDYLPTAPMSMRRLM